MSLISHSRAKIWLPLSAAAVFLLAVPLPYPPNSSDREAAVSEALSALLHDTEVLTKTSRDRLLEISPTNREHLLETDSVKSAKGNIYYENEVNVPEALFLTAGLKPIPKDRKIDFDTGDVVVRFAFTDDFGKPTWYMRFSYVFGNVGGICYQIRIYKAFWTRRIVYAFEWIA
jgi:hypothetical protein